MQQQQQQQHVASLNLYQVIGVAADAAFSDIRQQYRAKLIRLHPDKAGSNPDLAQKLQQLREAWQVSQGAWWLQWP